MFEPGDKVVAIVGGLGRSLNGSYAERVVAPRSNVAAVRTDLSWAELAAIPESYATAWTALIGVLELEAGQTVLVRGATSALGQAAINIAHGVGARVIGVTRKAERKAFLRELGADLPMIEDAALSKQLRERHPEGIDAVLDIVGNSTVLDSLAMLKRKGAVCEVGFLGGAAPLTLQPVFEIPSGRRLTTFASALATGSGEFPISEIPFQQIVDHVANGAYKARPARVLPFEQIQEGHRAMEAGLATGKMVVTVDA
jgi:NADPH:quinone reductase-like Zn-dependent oxidoreductase